MTGRVRRTTRGPAALPWRTSLLAALLALAVIVNRGADPEPARAHDALVTGDTPQPEEDASSATDPAGLAATGPGDQVRELPAAEERPIPALPAGAATGEALVAPASFTGQ